jgi:hypothetical protein
MIGEVKRSEVEHHVRRRCANYLRQPREAPVVAMQLKARRQLLIAAAFPQECVNGPAVAQQPLGKLAADKSRHSGD